MGPGGLPGIILAVILALPARGMQSFAAEEPPPNIVVICMDAVRPDHLDLYGYERETALNVRRIAGKGIVFTGAYSTSCWTLPALGSFFTGLAPEEHRLTNPQRTMRPNARVLGEELSRRGYDCAAFVSGYTLHSAFGFGRGFRVYDDYSAFLDSHEGLFRTGSDLRRARNTVTSPIVTRTAVQWLRKESRRPFFLFLHYFDSHDAYIPPGEYRSRFDPDYEGPVDGNIPHAFRPEELSERDRQHLIALYDGEIAWVDHHIGLVYRELESLGLLDSTVVVLFSDHGEAFGEHGLFRHGNSLYEEAVRIALVISWPSRYRRRIDCDVPVSLAQLNTTIRSIAGIEVGATEAPTLVQIGEGGTSDATQEIYGSVDYMESAQFFRSGEWKLIRWGKTNETELYNLRTDPNEKSSLASENAGLAQELVRRLENTCASTDEPAGPRQEGGLLAKDVFEKIKSLGYY